MCGTIITPWCEQPVLQVREKGTVQSHSLLQHNVVHEPLQHCVYLWYTPQPTHTITAHTTPHFTHVSTHTLHTHSHHHTLTRVCADRLASMPTHTHMVHLSLFTTCTCITVCIHEVLGSTSSLRYTLTVAQIPLVNSLTTKRTSPSCGAWKQHRMTGSAQPVEVDPNKCQSMGRANHIPFSQKFWRIALIMHLADFTLAVG